MMVMDAIYFGGELTGISFFFNYCMHISRVIFRFSVTSLGRKFNKESSFLLQNMYGAGSKLVFLLL